MSLDFEAFGRDVQSQADSAGDSALASAVKSFVQWFAGDAFPDGKWRVVASTDGKDASLTFTLVEEAAYVAPSTYEDVPATAEELARSGQLTPADIPAADPVPADVPATDVPPADSVPVADVAPVPSEPVPVADTAPAEAAPVDPPVAAPSLDVLSEPPSTSSIPAPEPYEGT